MPPEVKTYAFGDTFQVADLNDNGRIDNGEITSSVDGHVLDAHEAAIAMKQWGIDKSLYSLNSSHLVWNRNSRPTAMLGVPTGVVQNFVKPQLDRQRVDRLIGQLLDALSQDDPMHQGGIFLYP
jgi:hypothetical protein